MITWNPIAFFVPIFLCAIYRDCCRRSFGSYLRGTSSRAWLFFGGIFVGLQDLHDKQALSRISQKRDYGGPPPKLVNMADRRTFERLSDRAVHRREIDALQQTYLARQRDFQGSPNSGASQICSPSERRGPAPCPGILGRVSPGAGP